MPRLSRPVDQIKSDYDVVVVGSGYGGGVAASRFARTGKRVCVLERGREFQPGQYPRTSTEAALQLQVRGAGVPPLNPIGLYDFRLGEDIHVFQGCGLGGTSLVNANVSLQADPRVFDDARWPAEIRAELKTTVAAGYERAEAMLKPARTPEQPALAKLDGLAAAAPGVGGKAVRPPINVNFEACTNHVGVEQAACTNCGDCVTGCNYGAKNTTLMNYLPDAWNHGAEIFTHAEVRRVARSGDGRKWLVYYRPRDVGREKFDAPELCVTADIVVLAAGSLGSTEILLRSKAAGLACSDRVGESFTGNGDVLAFSYNGDRVMHGVGLGSKSPSAHPPVGPTITGLIDLRGTANVEDGFVIEEGAIPGPVSGIGPATFSAAAKVFGDETDRSLPAEMRRQARELTGIMAGPLAGAMDHTLTYLVMSHDDAGGRIVLEGDRAVIKWPGVGSDARFQKVNDQLRAATAHLGATFLHNVVWTEWLGRRLITVHPLGGCGMGHDGASGVVDHAGRVFDSNNGTGVYEGLHVWDGSIMPCSLGVNPLLTITALAERAAHHVITARGWSFTDTLPSKPANRPAPPVTMGLSFTETMRGWLSTIDTSGYEAANVRAKADGSRCEFTLTVTTDDLATMLKDEAHRAKIVGTVTAPTLSTSPLQAQGTFSLFAPDPEEASARRMKYEMTLERVDGSPLYFSGFKRIRSEKAGKDLWPDTTTLYVTVHDGPDASAPVKGMGILVIEIPDFAKQMTTLRVTDAPSEQARLMAVAQFGRFFAGTLFEVYGGIVRPDKPFDPGAPLRVKRELKAPAPEVHELTTLDGAGLRLMRYQGGDKGPVLLVHGLGVSSLIFRIDTVEENLVEHLCARGFDVWALDFRASIDLPAANSQYSGDDIARHDFPKAVRHILDVTGSPDLQAVVHCFGATTFLMSMLGGLRGVRSIVSSQIGVFSRAPLMTKLKTGLHFPTVLKTMGVKRLDAFTSTRESWSEKAYDQLLRLYPQQAEEWCDNPTCRRIAFMYAPLYEHDRLNAATHSAMHEMFGIATMKAFEHIAAIVNAGKLVAADGADIYLPNLARLDLPICFIHGAENQCFSPAGTQQTYDELRARFPRQRYAYHPIPNFGHIDCIFGKDAHRHVYPLIAAHLEQT